jgi:hypothetical protein
MIKKFSPLALFLFFSITIFGQSVTVSEWESQKKLIETTREEARNYVTNELIFTHSDGIFSDAKTNKRVYELDGNILIDIATGKKLYEKKGNKVIDIQTGQVRFSLNKAKKTISDEKTGKKILGLSSNSILTYRLFFILIATDYIK